MSKGWIGAAALAAVLSLSMVAIAQGPGKGYGPGQGPGAGQGQGYGPGQGAGPGPGYGPGAGMGPGAGPGTGMGPGRGPGMQQRWTQERMYGSRLMTLEERQEHMAKMWNAKTVEERNKIRDEHRKLMQERATKAQQKIDEKQDDTFSVPDRS